MLHYRSKDSKTSASIAFDYYGLIKRVNLAPNDSHEYVISNDFVDPNKVTEIIVIDATGREFKHKLSDSNRVFKQPYKITTEAQT